MHEERFDKWLQEALDTDVRPGDDFTARVMQRVAATPQEQPRTSNTDKRKLKRMMTALAACAAVVILIPMGLLMMPKGSAAPADGAVQESLVMDDAADYVVADEARSETQYEAESDAAAGSDGGTNGILEYTDGDVAPMDGGEAEEEKEQVITTLYLFGDEATQVRVALAEMEREADGAENGAKVYDLTAEETARLHELLPDIIKQEGALHLMLEVAE